jgi:putative membrane protein insertion efficiency factor
MRSLSFLILLCSLTPQFVSARSPAVSADESTARPFGTFDYVEEWAKCVIHVYQSWISPVDGHQCPMTPTCSHYGLAVVDSLGWWTGMLCITDRLNRCKHDLGYYRLVPTARGLAYRDLP